MPTERPYHHGHLHEALLEAAEHTLREQGREQISLRALAREAGVSHAAPGRHFADRQALLDALAIRGFERLEAELRAALAGAAGADFPARLDAAFAACLRFATADAALLALMFDGKHRPGADAVRSAADGPFGLLERLMTEGETSGDLAEGTALEVGTLLFASVLGLAALANSSLIAHESLAPLADRAVASALSGPAPA